MNIDFIEALHEIEREKGINKEVLIDAIEAALISSYKRNFNTAQNVRVDINRQTGVIEVFARKTVVEEALDPRMEISLDAAHEINANYQRSEEHTSELQSRENLVCRLLLEKKKNTQHR